MKESQKSDYYIRIEETNFGGVTDVSRHLNLHTFLSLQIHDITHRNDLSNL